MVKTMVSLDLKCPANLSSNGYLQDHQNDYAEELQSCHCLQLQ